VLGDKRNRHKRPAFGRLRVKCYQSVGLAEIQTLRKPPQCYGTSTLPILLFLKVRAKVDNVPLHGLRYTVTNDWRVSDMNRPTPLHVTGYHRSDSLVFFLQRNDSMLQPRSYVPNL
jgi:hypothetical protein